MRQRLDQGTQVSVVELTREHMALVTTLRRHNFPTIQPQHWDDMDGAGMIGLVEAAIRYKPNAGATFTTYARKRILGAMRDQLRGKRHTQNGQRVYTQVTPTDPHHLAGTQTDSHDPISRWELTETLRNAIDTLPDKQRAIINLRYLHDMPVDDVAKICGLSKASVHVYAMQARRTLRTTLDRQALAA